MKTIFCKNKYAGSDGRLTEECHRLLGFMTDLELDMLKLDPEKYKIFRCPNCKGESKWVAVYYENNELVFGNIDKPDRYPEPDYDRLDISSQIA